MSCLSRQDGYKPNFRATSEAVPLWEMIVAYVSHVASRPRTRTTTVSGRLAIQGAAAFLDLEKQTLNESSSIDAALEAILHPTTHLLEHNYPPPDEDIPHLERVLAAAMEYVEGMREKIAGLDPQAESAIARLTQECEQAKALVYKHLKVLSLIRRFPPEILCTIFGFTMPRARFSNMDMVVDFPPWRMSHVSQSWRDAALGDPHLWNSIEIRHSKAHPVPEACPIPMLNVQCQRSGAVPLDITISAWDHSESPDPAWLAQFLANSARWRSLLIAFVEGGNSREFWDLITPIQGRLPLLEDLEIYNFTLPSGSDTFSVAPRLRKAVFSNALYIIGVNPSGLAIPWGQIVHYRGASDALTQLQILQQTRQITSAGCAVRVSSTFSAIRGQVVILPHLHHLELRDHEFLQHLRAPVLEDLYFKGRTVDGLSQFIEQSGCNLTSLTLVWVRDHAALPDILRCIPTLVCLTVDSSNDTLDRDMVVKFLDAMSSKDLCPNLRTLGYGHRNIGEIVEELVAMARSRRVGSKRPFCLRVWMDASSLIPFHTRKRYIDGMASISTAEKRLASEDGMDAEFINGLAAERWRDRNRASWIQENIVQYFSRRVS
ncbi:hypothetical protein FB45DRAFT_1022938 [Roridomyces roridus]|uniref:F-box domain-containing protein n=1 Tax=Roridomyces roridus TaxID=1738132 RepID=A0AAD7FXF4_9AGAR|nr:hypothetical protein FB45DRAFT_1022938 [Roridomyces roridus]